MKTKILSLAVLAGLAAPAFADTRTPGALDVAVAHERSAGTRVAYYARMTIIAERDRATAQIVIDMAKAEWGAALRANDADAAGYWAKRHRDALVEQRRATSDALLYRTARDAAREEFEASAREVRRHRHDG
ncbi:MAG: hypothetical protein ABI867_23340 [Kofleriaceae bacterium]